LTRACSERAIRINVFCVSGVGAALCATTPRRRTLPRSTALESVMSVELDHFLVPIRDRVASAKLLAELLGVPWAESGVGPFSPVYVNDGLTLDFIDDPDPFPIAHFCFRV